MLISVIVPVYNVESYLEKCINSILKNTYKNLEIVLVDDGSTDNSGAMCDDLAMKDNRIVVIHKENGGLSSARNAGLEMAKGEYISFIDSDDYISVDMYEKMLLRGREEDADIIQCGVYRVNEYGNLSTTFRIGDWSSRGEKILEKFYVDQMIPVMVCNKLFRQSLIRNIRFVEGRNNEDNMFMADVLPNVKSMVSVSDQMYYYLIRTNSITGCRFTEKKFDSIYAYKYVLKKTEEISDKYIPYVQYWRCMNSFYLWYDIKKSNIPMNKDKQQKYYNIVQTEFKNSYSYVIKLGRKICFKDRIRLVLFRINKNIAIAIYHRYLEGAV